MTKPALRSPASLHYGLVALELCEPGNSSVSRRTDITAVKPEAFASTPGSLSSAVAWKSSGQGRDVSFPESPLGGYRMKTRMTIEKTQVRLAKRRVEHTGKRSWETSVGMKRGSPGRWCGPERTVCML